jgi:hypothetical protein
LNLQQYKYRRNFPYNDTIKEDSAENLSDNKSSNTFSSMKPKRLINEVMMKQMKKMEFLEGNIDIIKEAEAEIINETDNFYGRKSAQIIRKFDEEEDQECQQNQKSSSRKDRKTSERYIKSSDEMGGSSKQVRTNWLFELFTLNPSKLFLKYKLTGVAELFPKFQK